MNLPAIAVLCSRLDSSRLPAKAFLPLGGRMAIVHCLSRLQAIGPCLVLAVPGDQASAFAGPAGASGAALYAGHPASPLHRTAAAVAELAPDARYIIRATHDDPLVDPGSARELLRLVHAERAGYGVCEGMVEGGGIEVIARENLDWAAREYHGDGEYISYYVKGPRVPNPKQVRLTAPEPLRRPYRLTLDYREDHDLLDSVLSFLGPDASAAEVCRLLDDSPELAEHNKLPLVGFYTCVRDGAKHIEDALLSVDCARTATYSEHVVVDDASRDTTALAVMRWVGAGGLRGRVRLVRNAENLGLASSSNIAVEMLRSKFVMRVDADDILIPGEARRMVELAERERADVVYAPYYEADEDGRVRGAPVENRARHAGCALMRRSFIYEARFKDGIRLGDSRELWERAEKWAVVRDHDRPAWIYRRHAGSLTAQ